MRLRRLAAATAWLPVVVGVLTACTSTTNGSGHTGRSSTQTKSVTSSTGTVTSPPASDSAPPTSTPSAFVRPAAVTAIGDPGTADLCAATGTDTFSSLAVSNVTEDPVQYPPGCSFTLDDASGPVLDVSVFAARHHAPLADGRTKRTASGLDVYSYPFNPHTGACPRDVMADHLRLVADAIARGSAEPDEQLSCAATDALADRLAEVAASGSVPQLSLAQPSVISLDACAVAHDAGITDLSDFASADLIERGFAVNCELKTDAVFLFINAALATTTPPTPSPPQSVAGHDLYEIESGSKFCSYASVQGTTGDGKHEEVTAAATISGSGKPPAQLCEQTAHALALYLTTAGLN